MPTDYCTAEELERYLSKQGVDYWSDHDFDRVQDDSVVADCIEQATDEINLFVLSQGRYDIDDLVGNRLLGSWCVILTACLLTKRRGNPTPESIAMECQRVHELLEKVKTGELNLPEVQRQGNGLPTFSNLTVDRRYHREKIRVTKANSSSITSSLEQDQANDRFYD